MKIKKKKKSNKGQNKNLSTVKKITPVLFYTIQLLYGKMGILCNFVDFSLIGENSRNIHVLLIC